MLGVMVDEISQLYKLVFKHKGLQSSAPQIIIRFYATMTACCLGALLTLVLLQP